MLVKSPSVLRSSARNSFIVYFLVRMSCICLPSLLNCYIQYMVKVRCCQPFICQNRKLISTGCKSKKSPGVFGRGHILLLGACVSKLLRGLRGACCTLLSTVWSLRALAILHHSVFCHSFPTLWKCYSKLGNFKYCSQ